jgi:hypothetical protein
MEAYPPQYTAHPYPLIILSGLAADTEESATPSTGPLITSNIPLVASPRKDELLQDFKKYEGSDEDWSGKHMRMLNPIVGYKFGIVGRVGGESNHTRNATVANVRTL